MLQPSEDNWEAQNTDSQGSLPQVKETKVQLFRRQQFLVLLT